MGSKRGQAITIGCEYVCDASKSGGLGQEADCKLACSAAQVVQRSRQLVLSALALSVCEHTADLVPDGDSIT